MRGVSYIRLRKLETVVFATKECVLTSLCMAKISFLVC